MTASNNFYLEKILFSVIVILILNDQPTQIDPSFKVPVTTPELRNHDEDREKIILYFYIHSQFESQFWTET